MTLSGIADEASPVFDEQLAAHEELGCVSLELRSVGLVLALENCSGWASASPATLRGAVEEIGSPTLSILFDTGNAVGDGGARGDSWKFYESARPYICHVHVKDCAPGPAGEVVYGWPGEGWGMVREILSDLAATGYEDVVSIEPHISGQIHKGSTGGEARNAREVYREHGRRTMAILREIADFRPD